MADSTEKELVDGQKEGTVKDETEIVNTFDMCSENEWNIIASSFMASGFGILEVMSFAFKNVSLCFRYAKYSAIVLVLWLTMFELKPKATEILKKQITKVITGENNERDAGRNSEYETASDSYEEEEEEEEYPLKDKENSGGFWNTLMMFKIKIYFCIVVFQYALCMYTPLSPDWHNHLALPHETVLRSQRMVNMFNEIDLSDFSGTIDLKDIVRKFENSVEERHQNVQSVEQCVTGMVESVIYKTFESDSKVEIPVLEKIRQGVVKSKLEEHYVLLGSSNSGDIRRYRPKHERFVAEIQAFNAEMNTLFDFAKQISEITFLHKEIFSSPECVEMITSAVTLVKNTDTFSNALKRTYQEVSVLQMTVQNCENGQCFKFANGLSSLIDNIQSAVNVLGQIKKMVVSIHDNKNILLRLHNLSTDMSTLLAKVNMFESSSMNAVNHISNAEAIRSEAYENSISGWFSSYHIQNAPINLNWIHTWRRHVQNTQVSFKNMKECTENAMKALDELSKFSEGLRQNIDIFKTGIREIASDSLYIYSMTAKTVKRARLTSTLTGNKEDLSEIAIDDFFEDMLIKAEELVIYFPGKLNVPSLRLNFFEKMGCFLAVLCKTDIAVNVINIFVDFAFLYIQGARFHLKRMWVEGNILQELYSVHYWLK